jgi:carbonic anhydrase
MPSVKKTHSRKKKHSHKNKSSSEKKSKFCNKKHSHKKKSSSEKKKPKELGLALSCIDYRLFDETIELLKHDCQVDAFDHMILAGASLGYNQHEFTFWKKTFIDHVELALQLHDIKKIVVVDHEDCGAYKLIYPHTEHCKKCEKKLHIKNINKFIKKLKCLYPKLHYSGYLLKLDGNYEKIYQDKFC